MAESKDITLYNAGEAKIVFGNKKTGRVEFHPGKSITVDEVTAKDLMEHRGIVNVASRPEKVDVKALKAKIHTLGDKIAELEKEIKDREEKIAKLEKALDKAK